MRAALKQWSSQMHPPLWAPQSPHLPIHEEDIIWDV